MAPRRSVPEGPSIAEESASSPDHEEQPDNQEKVGLCPEEILRHAPSDLSDGSRHRSHPESSFLSSDPLSFETPGLWPTRLRSPNGKWANQEPGSTVLADGRPGNRHPAMRAESE